MRCSTLPINEKNRTRFSRCFYYYKTQKQTKVQDNNVLGRRHKLKLLRGPNEDLTKQPEDRIMTLTQQSRNLNVTTNRFYIYFLRKVL